MSGALKSAGTVTKSGSSGKFESGMPSRTQSNLLAGPVAFAASSQPRSAHRVNPSALRRLGQAFEFRPLAGAPRCSPGTPSQYPACCWRVASLLFQRIYIGFTCDLHRICLSSRPPAAPFTLSIPLSALPGIICGGSRAAGCNGKGSGWTRDHSGQGFPFKAARPGYGRTPA